MILVAYLVHQWRKKKPWLVTSMDTGQHLESFLIKTERKAVVEMLSLYVFKEIGKLI